MPGCVLEPQRLVSRSGGINDLIKNDSTNGLVRGAGRLVYLKRYIGGVWQNMLVCAPPSSTGQICVGFIQSKVCQYRLLLTDCSRASGERSATTHP